MSFNSNYNNTINLGNYEEFFILYMDNELSNEQMQMVDAFLLAHPDLQAEFDILAGTKLPAEEMILDKENLKADAMRLNTIDEELLLYIDNELPADRKKVVEFEIASNTNYRLQHQLLLQTKLDAKETIAYPNKEELYHRTEKILRIKIWMRIAAAIVVVATMSVLYFTSQTNQPVELPSVASSGQPVPHSMPGKHTTTEVALSKPVIADNPVAQEKSQVVKTASPEKTVPERELKNENLVAENTIAPMEYEPYMEKGTTSITGTTTIEAVTASYTPSKEIINTSAVTSVFDTRKTSTEAVNSTVTWYDIAGKKGSIKSFLRKATRLIERRTGIDAANGEDEELLIGALAVKLK